MPTQDFDTYHGGAGGPPQGWVGVTTGSGAITYGQDVQAGNVKLATGATSNSEALLYLDNNIVIPAQGASFQCHIPALSAITSVVIRVGLAPRASWALWAAAGAIPAIGGTAEYFMFEFDTASAISTTNWVLRMQTGGAGETTLNSGVAAVTTTTKLIAMLDPTDWPQIYVNGIPTLSSAATVPADITASLCTPGIIISNTAAADRNLDLDMLGWEGDRT